MEKILNISLETQTAPKIREARNKDWIEYGTEDYANLYPQFLIDLYYNSSTHAAIINATADMIAGESITCEESDSLEALVKVKKFLSNANGKESLHEIMKKLAFDFKLQGAFAINVVWSKDRTEIAEIYHVPVERIRAGKPNELGQVTEYYICSDWSNTRENEPLPVPAFNLNDRTNPSQIIYSGSYSPMMDIYYAPDYAGGCNWALIDQKIAEFHLSNIQNGFSGSYFISFANGVPTQEERFAIEKAIKDKFTGAKASGKFVLTFSDDKNRTPEITPISVSNADKQYLALQELMTSNILVAHRVTSPMLMGIKNDTGLGNNADELNSAFEVYLNTVIIPYQNHLLKIIGKILDVNNCNIPLTITQAKPITSKFTIEDMKEVMTQDEIREELGLPPLESKEEYEHKKKKYAKLEAENYVDEWIAKHGEERPDEDWELLSDEKANDEVEEFEFERELNDLHKVEFASTGTARPNAKSEDEGIDRNFNLYKVRYRYATGHASSNSREFCRKMIDANKLYRKEDILQMDSEKLNKGWGPGGSPNKYSIWKFKGGGSCGHYWRREIYFFKLGVSTGNKIKDATKIITTTEARSRGFYPEPNEKEVSRIPRNMPNKGFVNKKG